MLRELARTAVDVADTVCAHAGLLLPHGSGTGSLTTVLFHSLFRRREDFANPLLAPSQNITVEDFRRCIGHILEQGYTPVSPADVDAGLNAGGKYVMITFDDGYFNNTLALEVLERFHAPATFFISSTHVLQREGYWWDVMHRELEQAGVPPNERRHQIDRAKNFTSAHIRAQLLERYGRDALRPRSDLDRPFTPAELKDFANNKWVHLGNHTMDHEILNNCSFEEMVRQIQGCQLALADMVGHAPITIAYPNGDYSEAAVKAARRCGLRLGMTVRPFSNRLPLMTEKSRMTLGRFMPNGERDMGLQWRKFNSDFVPSYRLKTLMMSAY